MLIPTTAVAVVAVLAGITGTWSPCGLSSVETLGSGLGDKGLGTRRLLATIAFTIAAMAGGCVTFGAAGLIGQLIGIDGSPGLILAIGLLVLTCGLADLRFLPLKPQIPNQVPESLRWRLPLAVTGALYGFLLGLGFTTYLLTYAMWALVGACIVLGSAPLGALVGVAFGIGRALPVLFFVGTFGSGSTQRFIEDMERRPMMLKGMRRVTGFALVLAALATVPVAAASSAPVKGAWNPSVFGSSLAYETAAGSVLDRYGSPRTRLDGKFAALGFGRVAWWDPSASAIIVAVESTLAVERKIPVNSVNAIALGSGLIVFRSSDTRTIQSVDLVDSDSRPKLVYRAGQSSTVGRPSVDGRRVVFSVASGRGSKVVSFASPGDKAVTVRRSGLGNLLDNPSVNDGYLAYVRTDRCFQTLFFGPVSKPSKDQMIARFRSTVSRDIGAERGFTKHYNKASLCPRRAVSKRRARLGSTAINSGMAWVTLVAGSKASSRSIHSFKLPRR